MECQLNMENTKECSKFDEMGISHDECIKAIFVHLFDTGCNSSRNEQLTESPA